jgi:hypothetical protein
VVHPEKVVVGGVVDAVVSFESEAEDGHANEVEEDGVVGTAANAGIGEAFAGDARVAELRGLFTCPLPLDGGFPGVVESFA